MKKDRLVTLFGDRPFFELREVLAASADDPKTLKNQLSSWVQKGTLTRLRRGAYLLNEPFRNQMPSVYYISNYLLRPSYVSLHTALQHYGMIPEAVYQTQAITPKHGRSWETDVGTFSYRSIKQDRFWGYTRQSSGREKKNQHEFLIARPEKTLLDLFYLQKGEWTPPRLREMRFQQMEAIQPDQLHKDAERFDSPKVTRAVERFLTIYVEDAS